MSTKATIVDELAIDKQGRYTVTGTEVTVKTTPHKKNALAITRKPGIYKVNIEDRFDHIIDKEPLYSHLIRKLTPVESVECPSTATDGVNLLWGRDFLTSMPEDEQCGVLLHEVLHCAFLHLWIKGDRNPILW